MIDTSYRRSLSHKVNGIIPKKVIDKLNKSKGWKYGYNKEYDVVIISKDGTIGDILEINDLKIALPKQPDDIRFDWLDRGNRKWVRYQVPRDLAYFDKIYKDEPNPEQKLNEIYKKHKRFIDEDIYRKFNGDWFMCDEEPIYITGYYYFFLQHYKLTASKRYPDFRMPQRDYFLFLEACLADNRCYGVLLLKSRRSGFSTSSGSITLCLSLIHI